MTSKCMMMSRRDGDRAVPVPLILPLSPLPQHLQHVSANIIKHVIQRNSFLEKLSIQKHIFFKLRGQFRVIWTEMNVFILGLEDDFSIPLCSVGWGGVTRFILLDSTVPGTGHLIGLSTTPTRTRTHWIPTLSWPSQRKGKFSTTSNIYMQSLNQNFVLS